MNRREEPNDLGQVLTERQGRALEVIFVNYGLFDSNSGGHTASFANALARQGARVSIIGAGDASSVRDFGDEDCNCYNVEVLEDGIPRPLLESLQSPQAVIHAWTPRRIVQDLTRRLIDASGCAYIVHLEDNEELLTANALGVPWAQLVGKDEADLDRIIPAHLSHPLGYKQFLANSRGATVITESLRAFVPTGVPTYLLEPGVDTYSFSPDMAPFDRDAARADLYINPGSTVIVYHGNMHRVNRREVFSLYTAMTILRRRGHDVVLIRAGRNFTDDLDVSMGYLRDQGVIDLGYLDRRSLINILKLADLFVQPGAVDEFNMFRFPSKIPEFLALGRPTVLPNTNIGLKLKNNEEALILVRGDGLEIADKVEQLLLHPGLAERLGAGARSYALANLNWDANARGLQEFYRQVI